MVKKVLITGVSGLLGGYLFRHIRKVYGPLDEYMVRGTYCSSTIYPESCYRMDITNVDEVERVVNRFRPQIIIHCAAIGSVDYCETHWELSRKINVDGAVAVANVASRLGAKMVFVSTNAVYAGDDPPYTEEHKRVPVNKYGWQKVDAEDQVSRAVINEEDLLTIRPIMLYGWPTHPLGRGNWATMLMDMFHQERPVKMVNDVITQPTYAKDCAKSIWALVDNGYSGAFNIGGTDRMTLYQFAKRIQRVYDIILPSNGLESVPSSYFPGAATRPQNTTYDMSKLYGVADALSGLAKDLLPGCVDRGLVAMRQEKL